MADDMLTELRALTASVQDVRERVIKIEARGIEIQVATIEVRVDKLQEKVRVLEDAENRRAGARGMFEFISKNGPGFVMMIVIFALGLLTYKGIIAR